MLKESEFTETQEQAFVQHLETELEKVNQILKSTAKEELDSSTRFSVVKDECSRITLEINELSKFIRLNYSGFLKILKKHDKHMPYTLKPLFITRLASHPFYKETFDALIIRLSKLFDAFRTGSLRADASLASVGSSFVRKTTKYWVHPDNVTELKLLLLKHLPVLVFSAAAGQRPSPAITSIYYDNDAFELYHGRLDKTEGAQAVRIRWYGGMEVSEIFVERKTHHEDWTGESSMKSRFPIKEKYVNAYCAGEYSMDKAIAKMRSRGQKSEPELAEMARLSDEVQTSIRERGLKPVLRTFYNRTAFQLPGDARVRVSLDTELTMVREDNSGRVRSGGNWRRTDIGIDFPFSQVPDEDKVVFPYAVLEVKLQTQHGCAAPAWVTALTSSHLVEEVPKFSKFVHGMATLREDSITLLPFWLPQMDRSIKKKPAPGYRSLSAGIPSHFDRLVAAEKAEAARSRVSSEEVRVEISEDEERVPLLRDSRRAAGSVRESEDEEEFNSSANFTPSNIVSRLRGYISRYTSGSANASSSTAANGNESVLLRAAPGKRIALPVRIEPKVFFANERTFLSWLHFCIVLGGLALGLLNFGDRVGVISGVIFTLVSLMFMLYALGLYHWRAADLADMIRNRNAGPYDDRLGPTVLVFTLVLCVIINFWLKFSA
ncbi:MAG: hypothetical protein SGCHY_004251 [Lobulomycetales sp.]